MSIQTVKTQSPLGNLNYLLHDRKAKISYLVDPFDGEQLREIIKEDFSDHKMIILLTHTHMDHIAGVEALVHGGVNEVWGHRDCEHVQLTKVLKEGDSWAFGGDQIQVIEVPGHKSEHIVFFIQSQQGEHHLISGDTLFFAGVGNCKNGGNPEELYQSIEKLKKQIPENTIIYPGHDYLETNLRFGLSLVPNNVYASECLNDLNQGKVRVPTRMSEELKFNPFLNLNHPELVLALEGEKLNESERFVKLRSLRDKW